MSISPNPVDEWAMFEYTLDETSKLKITLHESSGKALKTILESQQQTRGKYMHRLDFSNYPPGVYHLVVQSDNQFEALRIIKIK